MAPADELVLRPSKGKAIGFLIVSLVFVAIGKLALSKDDLGVGLMCTIVFGLSAVIFGVQLWPGASYLRLTSEGFIICSLFRVGPLVRWTEVSEFRVERLPPHGTRMVVYDSDRPSALRKLNRGLAGASDGLPDTYGMKPDALAELMNASRTRERRRLSGRA